MLTPFGAGGHYFSILQHIFGMVRFDESLKSIDLEIPPRDLLFAMKSIMIFKNLEYLDVTKTDTYLKDTFIIFWAHWPIWISKIKLWRLNGECRSNNSKKTADWQFPLFENLENDLAIINGLVCCYSVTFQNSTRPRMSSSIANWRGPFCWNDNHLWKYRCWYLKTILPCFMTKTVWILQNGLWNTMSMNAHCRLTLHFTLRTLIAD